MKMIFRGNEHKVIYTSILKRSNKIIYKISPEFLSALYLLTSYTNLWNRVKSAVGSEKIDFSKICLKNIKPDCYILCKAARDFAKIQVICFFDLADSAESINEKIYKLILNAIGIRRKGSKVCI